MTVYMAGLLQNGSRYYITGTQTASVLIDNPAIKQITEAQFSEIRTKGYFHPNEGSYRWEWVGGQPVELSDTRPLVEFSPTEINLLVGGSPGTVTISLPNNPGFSGTRYLRLPNGNRVAITFSNGSATVNIPTKSAKNWVIGSDVNFVCNNPLILNIYQTDFD